MAPVTPVLLVGCVARTLRSVHLLEALEQLGIPQAVSEAAGQDWRLIDYVKGARAIASRLTLALRDGAILPTILYVEADTALATHVVPVLEVAGWVVIRGAR